MQLNKKMLLLVFVLFEGVLSGQKLTDKVGVIEAQLFTNRKDRPHTRMYFDSTGLLLKKLRFGKHHNMDLKLLDKIEIFRYSGRKLTQLEQYESDYDKNIYLYWKTICTYDENGRQIDETIYDGRTDSMLGKTVYTYDQNIIRGTSVFGFTTSFKKESDSLSRRISFQQIYENKIRWEWRYTYTDTTRVGTFQTYYTDGKNYSKKEIRLYKGGQLMQHAEFPVSEEGLAKKIKFYYHDTGVMKRIEFYKSYSKGKEFRLEYVTGIKLKTNLDISAKMAAEVNNNINWE